MAALAGLSFACGDAASNAVDGRIDASARAEAAALEEPFAWPVDPSHPVLEIEIESSASSGRILIELMPELAPATVVQVIELANEGFYDQTTFHRVIPGFMIQGGDPNSRDRDPTNDGRGPTGHPLHDEFGDTPFVRGVVGMGNKGRQDSTSTQFFIMHDDNEELNGRYTAVGRVLAGMEVVDDITRVPIDRIGRWGPKDRPIENVVMARVRTIGQVADVKAALEGESVGRLTRAEPKDAESREQEKTPSTPASPPAAPSFDEEWQRLEASGR